ncbi:MAG: non-canonical purine NTP diphosphatase [Flavobacteriaceae bacterium]
MKIVFATHNPNKLVEVQRMLPGHIELLSLDDIGHTEEIPETGSTIRENAQIKANHVSKKYQLPCFADDTGLLVDSLDGAPGVYSARYAGEAKNAEANMDKLLGELRGTTNRAASFKTVIALVLNQEKHLFEGVVNGEITHKKMGDGGFGYDPIFMPRGHKATFAQLPMETKNKIGHRGKAVQELVNFLKAKDHASE